MARSTLQLPSDIATFTRRRANKINAVPSLFRIVVEQGSHQYERYEIDILASSKRNHTGQLSPLVSGILSPLHSLCFAS